MVTKEECFKQLRDVIDAVLSTVDDKGNDFFKTLKPWTPCAK